MATIGSSSDQAFDGSTSIDEVVPIGIESDAARSGAAARVRFVSAENPHLQQREIEARLTLTAAIMQLDEAEDTDAVVGGLLHSLHERALVELAKNAYAQALADLIRGGTRPRS